MNFNYTRKDLLLRLFWSFGSLIFSLTPKHFYALRHNILRLFGARIGEGSKIYPSVKITFPWNLRVGNKTCVGHNVRLYNLGQLNIGNSVTISQGAHLCGGSHDYSKVDTAKDMPLIKSEINVEDSVWICADAFIGPSVTVSKKAIIGARAVVINDVPECSVYAGNPARLIKVRDD